jgi:hypothetical protein
VRLIGREDKLHACNGDTRLLASPASSEGQKIRRVLITGLGYCLLLAPTVCPQGFGNLGKKKVVLHRKLPPVIQFTGTTFSTKVTSRDPKYADLTGKLKDLLETELLKDNDRLRADANSAELAIICTVNNFSVPPPQPFTRNEVIMEKGKQLEQPVQYNKITGSLEVSYQAKDPRAGRVLDADNITASYSEDFEAGTNQQAGKSLPTKVIDPFKRMAGKKTQDSSGPPNPTELREDLIHKAIHEIASRITATNEPVEIMLAQGKLDKANKTAEHGLWSRYLEELERMPAFPNAKDDAYRLYNIGVAYEALAYQTEDHKAAKNFLQEAAINYGKAVDAKREEKYFLEPQKRIETAMAYYRKIEGQQKAVEAANAPPAPTEPTSNEAAKSPGRGATKTPSGKAGSKSPTSKSPTDSKSVSSNGKVANSNGISAGNATGTSSAGPDKLPGAPTKPVASAPALTNDQIIKMAKAGVDEDSIIATIHDAQTVQFDLSPDGQIQLASSGVKAKILAAMRQRAKLGSRRTPGGGYD